MKRLALFGLLASTLLLVVLSCSKSNKNNNSSTPTSGGGDSILANIGNNIIMPGYQGLATAVNSLDSAITDFNAGATSGKLSNVQGLFKNAYMAWEAVEEFDYIGAASTVQPVLSGLDIFPTSESLIDGNIASANYNVNTFANTAAKGFPALDYLLFGGNVVVNYTTDAQAVSRQKYLAAVSLDIKTEVNAVLTQWTSTYLKTFLSGSGNSVSSSLGLLINSMDQDFEILKNNRLGVPLGKIPVGTTAPVAPKEVEAYYSGISSALALAQLKAVQGLYLGTAGKGNGLGLANYLINAKSTYNGGQLSDTIRVAFAANVTAMQAVADPLSQTLQTNFASPFAAFAQSQKMVAFLKADMPSALGVLITYGDNDGD